MTDKIDFDMDAALQAIRKGTGLTGKGGALTPLIKQLTEAAMKAELEEHLAEDDSPNRKNGSGLKTVKSPSRDTLLPKLISGDLRLPESFKAKRPEQPLSALTE